MTRQELYNDWVERVMAYASNVGEEVGRHIATMQAAPFFDKQSEILFMGINPGEEATYTDDNYKQARERFFSGNPYKPEVWGKRWNWIFNPEHPENSFSKAGWGEAVKEGNYLFSNLIFFGSPRGGSDLADHQVMIAECVKLSSELIMEILQPKCVICLSVDGVFGRLRREIGFEQVKRLQPLTKPDGSTVRFRVLKGEKEGILFYGIPHLSGAVGLSKMDFDTIVRAIKEDFDNNVKL